jgi:hypothetical protein
MTLPLFTEQPTPPWTAGKSWAAFSSDKRYRYALGRHIGLFDGDQVGNGRDVLVVMLNPSVAGEDDDPTIRKLTTFGHRLRWRSFVVVNCFAAVATDPKDLLRMPADERIGPLNDHWIREAMRRTELTIAAWGRNGTRPQLASRVDMVTLMLRERTRDRLANRLAAGLPADYLTAPIYTLRELHDGVPEHPLFLPGDSKPKPWLGRLI